MSKKSNGSTPSVSNPALKPEGALGKVRGRFDLSTILNYSSFLLIGVAFLVVSEMQKGGQLTRQMQGWLVPVCCYIVMAISLNLTVGIMGELSLGHAGFMSLGAFAGVVASQSLIKSVPDPTLRLVISMCVGAAVAAFAGFIIGLPVLRLRGDYLAIVTLAFGEIIMDVINCLIVGFDQNGLHVIFNFKGDKSVKDLNLAEGGIKIIKGAQGATGIKTVSTFAVGVILILITLFIVLNFIRSRTGRAVIAIRDNRIAAESSGINVMKYKMITFVISTMLAGAAGALYGLNQSTISATKFNFNTSIMILVYVVLGGLGNIFGSIIATAVLYILPEALRQYDKYRMLIYAIVLILVMIATNNPQLKALLRKLIPGRKREPGEPKPQKKAKNGAAAQEGGAEA